MNEQLKRILLILSFSCLVTSPILAGGVAEFGTVSKSKITLNPAGAAAIDRILFDFTLFNYAGGNEYAPFNNQIRDGSGPGDLYFEEPPDSSGTSIFSRVKSVQYESGETTGLHVDLAYPTAYFTVGVGFDSRIEKYEEGRYLTYSGNVDTTKFADGTPVPGILASYERKTTGILVAIPLGGVSIGFRQNQREITHEISELEGIRLADRRLYNNFGASSDWPGRFSSEGEILGKSSYQYYDFGMMFTLSSYAPKFDVGLLYRPSFRAILEFDPTIIEDSPNTNYTLQDLPFTEPGLKLITTNLEITTGRAMIQVIAEAGDFLDTADSIQAIIRPGISERDRTYDITGYLLRFAYNPFFSIAYGIRSQEIAGSLTELITTRLKFPVPIYSSLIVAIGSQKIIIKDYKDRIVAESTSYSFSTEMKFGKPVSGPGRKSRSITGKGLPPKTKRLPYYMEF